MPEIQNTQPKLVVLTGVSHPGQVGEALAAHFASSGFSLALIGRSLTNVEARVSDLPAAQPDQRSPQGQGQEQGQGQKFSAHAADLSDASSAVSVAAEIMHVHKTSAVYAVVCVAGGFGATGPLDEASPDAWRHQFSINLDTAFNTTRAFLPSVREAHGSFVYFASAAALPSGSPKGLAAYAAAKSGLIALMRAVAADEKHNQVRANAVAPTAIRTASNMASMGEKANYVERESVADAVAFLISEAARNITGQVITLS